MVDHRHLADKGDIVKMAKVWVDARDYLFILVSQSLQRMQTKLCSQFIVIKLKYMTRCFEKRIHCRIRRVQIGHGRKKKSGKIRHCRGLPSEVPNSQRISCLDGSFLECSLPAREARVRSPAGTCQSWDL